jgi:hypothetical protein
MIVNGVISKHRAWIAFLLILKHVKMSLLLTPLH